MEVGKLEDAAVLDELVAQVGASSRVVVHCQLSQKRGPKAAALLAERLKELAGRRPELQVLRGGFQEFGTLFKDDPQLVEGQPPAPLEDGQH